MTWASRWAVAAVAAILVYQLLVPPIVGMADQGDYARLSGLFGLGPATRDPAERFYGYLNRRYVPDPDFRTPTFEMLTSEWFFAAAAVGLNGWISKDESFDLRFLGCLHVVTFLVLAYWILATGDRLLPPAQRWVLRAVFLVILVDPAYVAYFNSFYSEPASLLFLLAVIGAALAVALQKGASMRGVLIWTAGAVGLIFAKPQNCLVGLLLAGYAAVLASRAAGPKQYLRYLPASMLAAASCLMYLQAPPFAERANTFNHLFMQLLPLSHQPAKTLAWFGLDEKWIQYSGVGAYAPGSPFADPELSKEVAARVSYGKIGLYYLEDPAALWRLTRKNLRDSAPIRPTYGNFERSAGYPAGFHSRAFSVWSDWRGRVLSRYERWPFFWLLVSIPAALWLARRSDGAERVLNESYALLATCAVAALYTAILGDGNDTVKHLFLYNLLLDLCIVASGQWVVMRVLAQFDLAKRFGARESQQNSGEGGNE